MESMGSNPLPQMKAQGQEPSEQVPEQVVVLVSGPVEEQVWEPWE